MRRAQLRSHRTWLLAVILVTAGLVTPLAADGIPYDDRPPLLASEAAPLGIEAATELSSIRLGDPPAEGVYEVHLVADGALPYDVFTLTGPNRIVIDLPGVVASDRGASLPAGEGELVQVRVGQYREDPAPMARVVLDLTEPMEWEIRRSGSELTVFLADDGSGRLASLLAPGVEAQPLDAGEPADAAQSEVVVADATPGLELRLPDRPTPQPASVETAADLAAAEPSEAALTEATPSAPQPAVNRESAVEPEAAGVEQLPAEMPAFEAKAASEPTPNTAPAENDVLLQPEIAKVVEQAADLTTSMAPMNEEKPLALPTETTSSAVNLPTTEAKTIEDGRRIYRGKRVSLQLVEADIKQVFQLFHEMSGLNFVLDPAVAGTVTIVVDEVPWDQALDLILKNNGLDMVMEGNVIRIAPIAKLAQEAAARKALHEAKELEAPPVTKTRTLSYAKAEDIEEVVRDAILSPKGRVIVDERTNTLIIRDIPTRVEAIDRLLTTLDAETPQVMIEARIVEVSRDFVKDLGVNWGIFAAADPDYGNATSLDFPHRAAGSFDLNLPKNPAATSLGFSFGNVLDSFTLDITLDALESEGYARRLSQPKIATQNNAKAEIEQGVRIPVVSTTATEIDVRFVAASLRLMVTPQITAEGTVVLDIEVENNSPDFVNTVGEIPAINTQRAQTKVLIADGGTTVIGGIFTVNEGENESGVPWFRSIPGLGWLFRSKNIQTRNRELLIFITPRIIKAS